VNAIVEQTAPIPSRKSRPWLRWIGWAVGGLLSLLLLLACAGAVYQLVATNRDRRLNPPPGLLVAVGGYRMHLDCTGQGSPTVILDSGIGDSWLSWYRVQPPVGQFTRVCSYDGAGMGWSDPSPKPRTSREIAMELHVLLHNAGISPPFVLVGHSFGGLNMRMYAALQPTVVAGMVLVDSTPDSFERFPSELKSYNERFLRKEDLKQNTMPLGIPRLMGWCGNGPPELRSVLRAIDCRLQPWREHLAEYHAGDESMAQVRASGLLGNIPVVVISHDPGKSNDSFVKAMEKAWDQAQEELTHLSTNSYRVIAQGSRHNIQLDRPDIVIDAIHKVVDICRERNSVPTGK
jgi:pimeloyl-ACP methyl ester carboxylesterase